MPKGLRLNIRWYYADRKDEPTANTKMVLRKDEKVEQEGIVEKQQRINKDWLVLSTNCATTNDKINVNIINQTRK